MTRTLNQRMGVQKIVLSLKTGLFVSRRKTILTKSGVISLIQFVLRCLQQKRAQLKLLPQ
jgi:hypothetical protein